MIGVARRELAMGLECDRRPQADALVRESHLGMWIAPDREIPRDTSGV